VAKTGPSLKTVVTQNLRKFIKQTKNPSQQKRDKRTLIVS
jgi:hypothetical protein